MRFEIAQRFYFDAAHTLRRQVEAESSARVHGHTYHGEVALTGTPDASSGMVVDLGVLRAELAAAREALDHRLLDEVDGLGSPTLENLCLFLLRRITEAGLPVSRVSVWREGAGDRCDLRLD